MDNILLMSLNFMCIAVIYYDEKNFRKTYNTFKICYSYNGVSFEKLLLSLYGYIAMSELNVLDNASPSMTRSHGLRTRKTTTRTTTVNVSFGTFRRWCLGDGVVHHFSHTTRGRMVFAIPLADDHPDNALKDRYLSRNEPGTLSYDFITEMNKNLLEFGCCEKCRDNCNPWN